MGPSRSTCGPGLGFGSGCITIWMNAHNICRYLSLLQVQDLWQYDTWHIPWISLYNCNTNKKPWSTNILLSQNPNFFERLTEYHSKREESNSVQFKSYMLNQKRPSNKNKLGHAKENSTYTGLKQNKKNTKTWQK